MADVFISYARSTAAQAQAAAEGLRDEGYSVWIDDQLPAHREYPEVIEENLRSARAVLVLWSRDARASRWVPAEADVAHGVGTLVQMTLDGALPPLPFNRMHCEHAAGWQGDRTAPAWRKVLASVGELVGRSPASTVAKVSPAARIEAESSPRALLLAVLAFDNLSADAELAYFCDGVSEEIQRTVANGSALKVVARSSSFQFRGADKDTAKVAAALGTTHLLDGSVRRSGGKVRISAELVECASRSTVWTDRYDGDLENVFELQDHIAAEVAHALKASLSPARKAVALEPRVYETFLQARGILADGDPVYDDSASIAAPLLEEVTRAAPDHAAAWELLATARAWMLRSGRWTQPYDEGRDGVISAAQTALRLDSGRAGAHCALAMLEPWGAYDKREALLRRALAAAPHDPAVLTEMSTFCWSVGRFRDALGFAEQACELNPLIPTARLNVAQMRAYVGDYETCVRMHQDLHAHWPRNPGILMSLLNVAPIFGFWDAYDAAVGDIESFEGWQAADMRATRAYAEALRSGDPIVIAKRVDRYTELLERTGTFPLNLVVAIAAFGLPDVALGLAERASYDFVFDPDGARPSAYFPGTLLGRWNTVMANPRFVRLCERLGLCRYWIDSGAWPDCTGWAPYDFKAEVLRVAGANA